jgi:mono/diheme cytochrome c family protein
MAMNLSLESKALGCAVLAASLSLGGSLLLAGPIKALTASGTASPDAANTEIAVSPALADQGHQFFEMSCSQCHADDATGDEGPNLHNLSISNARIATTIKKGVKGQMPTFAKKYDDQQIAALVSYLRSLR